jgi:CheY-like chemotaxis protein
MDDEPLIRDVVTDMLSELGYEVHAAADGAEALALYSQATAKGLPFDAVIMDLTVPGGMGGREAMERLRGLDPEVRAIVSSGYSADPILSSFRDYGFRDVVAKPYTVSRLAQVLERVLAGP